ncbi:Lambda phage tail tape-measure protein [compost metagenome]
MDNLLQQRNEGRISPELYQKENDALQKALDQRLAMQESYYQEVDTQQADWSLGARSAFASYLEQARDTAGQTRTLFSNAFSSMEDAVASFAISGKYSFADFTKSVLADMARIATQKAIAGLAGGILGSSFGAYFTPGGQTVSTSGFSEGNFVANAKGGVYDSPSLSQYSNQVHDTPKFFAFAKGAGVFAEAGPEAIMPLTRGADGNLGVRAVGGGSGRGGNTYNFPLTFQIDASGLAATSSATDQDPMELGRNIQAAAKAEAEKAIANGLRQGGSIWRVINGRA